MMHHFLLDRFSPLIKKRPCTHPRWFSNTTIRILKDKLIYHKKWRCFKNVRDRAVFCKLRSELKERIKSEYQCYVSGVERDIKSDSKSFWKFAKSQKRNEAGIPSAMALNEEDSRLRNLRSYLQNTSGAFTLKTIMI
jgi:hypothetical protein